MNSSISMRTVDFAFPIVGTTVAVDHGYHTQSTISRRLGRDLHERNALGIHPIRGRPIGKNLLQVDDSSRLCIRTPLEFIPRLLILSGQSLDIGGHTIRLGVPQVLALEPASSLYSRLVTIKGFEQPEPFLEAVQRQLDSLGVAGRPAIPLRTAEPHQGEPTRRVLRIKDKTVVGFALIVSELTADESLTIQEKGIGGRRHMGCGVFVPHRPR